MHRRRRRRVPVTRVGNESGGNRYAVVEEAFSTERMQAALCAVETRRRKGGKRRQKRATTEKEIRARIEKAKEKQADYMRKLKLATNRVSYWQRIERQYRKRLEELLVKERDLASKADKVDRYIELEDTSD